MISASWKHWKMNTTKKDSELKNSLIILSKSNCIDKRQNNHEKNDVWLPPNKLIDANEEAVVFSFSFFFFIILIRKKMRRRYFLNHRTKFIYFTNSSELLISL